MNDLIHFYETKLYQAISQNEKCLDISYDRCTVEMVVPNLKEKGYKIERIGDLVSYKFRIYLHNKN